MLDCSISATDDFEDLILRDHRVAMHADDASKLVSSGIEAFIGLEIAGNKLMTNPDLSEDECRIRSKSITRRFRELAPVASIFCKLLLDFERRGIAVERAEEFFEWTDRIVSGLMHDDVADDRQGGHPLLPQREREAQNEIDLGETEEGGFGY